VIYLGVAKMMWMNLTHSVVHAKSKVFINLKSQVFFNEKTFSTAHSSPSE